MASKKETIAGEAQLENGSIVEKQEILKEVTGSQEESKEDSKEQPEAAKKKAAKPKEEKPVELPAEVEKILKMHPSEQELYVDNHGGVFTKGTPKQLLKKAVLYSNPFYKN